MARDHGTVVTEPPFTASPISPGRAARMRAVADSADAICRKYNLDDLGDATADMLIEQDELIRAAGFTP